MKKLILLISLFLIAGTTRADNNGANALSSLGSFFSLSQNDYSYAMLTRLFGQVGGVLPGQIGLLGTMFYTFNQVVLALGIIVVIYTVVMSILHTAHEGEFMGKNYNSMWVPVRTILGILLLIPTASGYSLIQIFMMWLVLQGVGAADSVWQSALAYIQNNNSVISAIGPQFSGPTVGSTDTAVSIAQNVLLAEICMQRAYQLDNSNSTAPYSPTFNSGSSNSNASYSFSYEGVNCGSISWPYPTNTLSQNIQSGIQEMVTTLNNTAYQYVTGGASAVTGINPIQVTSDNLSSLVQDAQSPVNTQASLNTFWAQANQYGWADAGGYYQSIATLGQGGPATGPSQSLNSVQSPDVGTINNADTDNFQDDNSFVSGLVQNVWNMGNSNNETSLSIGSIPGNTAKALNSSIAHSVSEIQQGFLSTLQNENPMVALQYIGNKLLQIVGDLWAVALTTITVGGLVANICRASNPAGPVFNLVISMFSTPAVLMSGIFMTAGLTLSVYIPLIPYIIFTFGVIGWLIAVIETMLAAPLVALGITHPEGKHEVLGHAEPAMMLMVNVFMRPTLMIFGLLAGMLVSYVGLQFVNWLYMGAVGGSLSNASNTVGGANYVSALMMYIVIYVGIIIALLNKSFSLVHIIPDRILNWIGGSHAQFGDYARGGEEETKQTFGAGAQKSSDARQTGASEAGKMSGKVGDDYQWRKEHVTSANKESDETKKNQNEAGNTIEVGNPSNKNP